MGMHECASSHVHGMRMARVRHVDGTWTACVYGMCRYGTAGGSYEEGWLHNPQPSALDAGLRAIAAGGPYDGVIGFSQGGAIASLVEASWAAERHTG